MNSNLKKQENQDKIKTIDKKHTEMLDYFYKINNEIIPKMKEDKNKLKQDVYSLKKNQLDEFMELKSKIKLINEEIKKLRTLKKQYFLENSKILFNYFEEKKQISNGEKQNKNVLNSFFKIKNDQKNGENVKSAKSYCHNYWKNVTNEITNIGDFVFQTDVCRHCNNGELIPHEEDGVLICNNRKCGKITNCMIEHSKPVNKEPPNEISYTAYIRLNHFKEILSQFQAKETTQIPPNVIKDIKNRIKKERIQDLSKEMNYEKMREILRKLGYNKYFEHIQYINSIFGIKPPIMNEELIETLCNLFIEIQKPWAIHCPANRTNFFNYTYTLYQLCVLLDQKQYLLYIPLLKDRDKQIEQDMIWKMVCNDLDWEFFPTV